MTTRRRARVPRGARRTDAVSVDECARLLQVEPEDVAELARAGLLVEVA
jgi:hypothetical protein